MPVPVVYFLPVVNTSLQDFVELPLDLNNRRVLLLDILAEMAKRDDANKDTFHSNLLYIN